MINTETFNELINNVPPDFALKVVQANVIASKTKPIDSDFDGDGRFLARLITENAHNGITKEHYDFAVELYTYQSIKAFNRLGGSKAIFPKHNA